MHNIIGKSGNNKLKTHLQNSVSVCLLQSVLPMHQVRQPKLLRWYWNTELVDSFSTSVHVLCLRNNSWHAPKPAYLSMSLDLGYHTLQTECTRFALSEPAPLSFRCHVSQGFVVICRRNGLHMLPCKQSAVMSQCLGIYSLRDSGATRMASSHSSLHLIPMEQNIAWRKGL